MDQLCNTQDGGKIYIWWRQAGPEQSRTETSKEGGQEKEQGMRREKERKEEGKSECGVT